MNSIASYVKAGLFLPYLKDLVQIILNPHQGWQDAEKDDYDPKSLLISGLSPFLIVVALTSLLSAIYRATISVSGALITGITDFTGYFVGVFVSNALLNYSFNRWFTPGNVDDSRIMTFVVYCIGSMALITMIKNIFPVDLALLSFLPLYVVYIMWGAVDYLGISNDRKGYFILTCIILLFIPPYFLSYLLDRII